MQSSENLRNGILLIAHDSLSLEPIVKKITGQSELEGGGDIPWRVETKYYNASLTINCRTFKNQNEFSTMKPDVVDNCWEPSRWDAIVWVFDPSNVESTLSPLWTFIQEFMASHGWEPNITVALSINGEAAALPTKGLLPDVERLDGDDDEADFGQDEDDTIDGWLARQGFELVESHTDEGWSRLIEALQAHMWDGFEPVSGDSQESIKNMESVDTKENPRVKMICDMLARIEDEEEDFDLETMLKEIKSLREHAQTLPNEKRHDIAEELAISIASQLLTGDAEE